VVALRERPLLRGLAFLLTCSALSFALVRFLPRLSFLRRPAGTVVSYGSLHGHAPAENLALYALALALAALAGAFFLRGRQPSPGAEHREWPRAALALAVAMLAAVAVNASWVDPAARMLDTFHEGEMLAYLPSFRSAGGLAGAMIIHGPGIDLAPSLIASWLQPGSVIATTRVLHTLQGLLFWAGFCWGMAELLSLGPAARLPRWLRVALLLICAVPLGATGFTGEMSRKTVLAVQFAVIARGLRCGPGWWLAALLGASVPLGFLYNYLEGMAGAVLVVAGGALWWVRGERRAAAVSGLAAVAGCAVALAVARPTCLAAFEQVGYWARNGQLIWGVPLRRNSALVLTALFGPLIALQAAAGLRLWRARRLGGSWQRVAVEEAALLLALLVSLSCARSWIDRADDLHLELAGWMTVPLLLVLVRPFLADLGSSVRWRAAAGSLVAAVPILGLAGLPVANPLLAASRLMRAPSASATADADVVGSSYVDVAGVLATELGPSDCFWTLTSEGVWYLLLDRRSCSRFHQAVYARSDEAQAEVIADLERMRPPVILFANADWWNRVDGIPVSVTNVPIQSYVLSRYRPWRRVGEHWLWKRAQAPLARVPTPCVAGSAHDLAVDEDGIGRISGSAGAPGRVVYVGSGDGTLAGVQESAGLGGEWTMEVAAGALSGARAYAYDRERDALLPFCTPPEALVGMTRR
jgi:hypothetical protein